MKLQIAAFLMLILSATLFAYEPELAAPGANLVNVTVAPAPVQPADAVSILTVIPDPGGTVTVNGSVITSPTQYDLNVLPLVDGYRVHIQSVPNAGNRTWIQVGAFSKVLRHDGADEAFIVELEQGEDTDSAVVRYGVSQTGSSSGGGGGCAVGVGSHPGLWLISVVVALCIMRGLVTQRKRIE